MTVHFIYTTVQSFFRSFPKIFVTRIPRIIALKWIFSSSQEGGWRWCVYVRMCALELVYLFLFILSFKGKLLHSEGQSYFLRFILLSLYGNTGFQKHFSERYPNGGYSASLVFPYSPFAQPFEVPFVYYYFTHVKGLMGSPLEALGITMTKLTMSTLQESDLIARVK